MDNLVVDRVGVQPLREQGLQSFDVRGKAAQFTPGSMYDPGRGGWPKDKAKAALPAPCANMGQYASRTPTELCGAYTDKPTCVNYAKYRPDGSVSPCNWLGNICQADFNERYACPPPLPRRP